MSDKFNNFLDGLCRVALGVGYGMKLSSIVGQILDLVPEQNRRLAAKLLEEYRDTIEEMCDDNNR